MCAPNAGAVDVQAYVKKDRFNDIKLSPNGDYYAATVPLEDRTALVISHRPVGLDAFDRLLFLLDGKLTPVAPGQLRELLTADDRAPWAVRSTLG